MPANDVANTIVVYAYEPGRGSLNCEQTNRVIDTVKSLSAVMGNTGILVILIDQSN